MSKRSLRGQPDPRAGHHGVRPRKPPFHQWRVAKPRVEALQTVDVMSCSWRRAAMLLALLAATIEAGVSRLGTD
jgi:hypothetical protein